MDVSRETRICQSPRPLQRGVGAGVSRVWQRVTEGRLQATRDANHIEHTVCATPHPAGNEARGRSRGECKGLLLGPSHHEVIGEVCRPGDTCRRFLSFGKVETAARAIHHDRRHAVRGKTHRTVANGPVVDPSGCGGEGVCYAAPPHTVPADHMPPRVPEGLLVWIGSRQRAFVSTAAGTANGSTLRIWGMVMGVRADAHIHAHTLIGAQPDAVFSCVRTVALVHDVENSSVLKHGVGIIEAHWPRRAVCTGFHGGDDVPLRLVPVDSVLGLTLASGKCRRKGCNGRCWERGCQRKTTTQRHKHI